MNGSSKNEKRILAIDPASRGFGFAVLEGPNQLIDWGVRSAKKEKQTRCLRLIEELIARYEPDAIVMEDIEAKGSRRCRRVADLIDRISKLAGSRKIRVVRLSRLKVRRAFSAAGANKRRIATAVAGRFPELAPRLPPSRKPWMSEDYRMSIFDAAAMGLAYVENLTV